MVNEMLADSIKTIFQNKSPRVSTSRPIKALDKDVTDIWIYIPRLYKPQNNTPYLNEKIIPSIIDIKIGKPIINLFKKSLFIELNLIIKPHCKYNTKS